MSEVTGQAANSRVANDYCASTAMLLAVFADEPMAMHSLDTLEARNDGQIASLLSAAVLRKDHSGKLHIKESVDTGDGQEGSIDGVIGAGIGVISGAALVAPATVEALLGGLAARLRASAFASERLHRLGKDLPSGASVIVAVVDQSCLEQIESDLTELGARTVVEQLDSDVAAQLRAGHDIAYATLVSRDGLTPRRAGDLAAERTGGLLVADDVGETASQFMTTEKGFVVRAIDVSGGCTTGRETEP